MRSGLMEMLDGARRTVAARAGLPDPGPSEPPRCPQTARQRREFEQALAQARTRVQQREEMLLAGGTPERHREGADAGGTGGPPQ